MNLLSPTIVSLNADLIEVAQTWKKYDKDIQALGVYNSVSDTINIELIYVPVSRRRQGICGQIIDEFTDLARIHGKNLTLTPVDSFGTPLSILIRTYMSYGFVVRGNAMVKAV